MVTPDESEQDRAERCAEAMWSGDAASAMLGMVIDAVGPGWARVSMAVRADMVNGWGVCHGGMVAALADSACALAGTTRGRVTVSAGLQVDFLEPAREGDLLVADAREVVRRGRSAIIDVTVRRGETVVAELRGRGRLGDAVE